jgi:UDP-glucose 4-epimerase
VRVLVTGASGFSGSYVARTLAEGGHDVLGLHRGESPFLARLAEVAGVRLVRKDLAEAAALAGPFDAVVHTAATSPAPGIDSARIVRDNIGGTTALIEAAARWGCRAFVFFSSLSVYGDVAGPVLDETSPIVNPDPYGMSKAIGERLLAEQAHVPAIALRLPGVIGPGAHRNWLSGVAARLRAEQSVRAFHIDQPFNNAAHIADIADLVARIIELRWTSFDSVILGARGTTTVGGAIARLARGLGIIGSIEEIPAAKPSFILSSERAIARWGYDPLEICAMIDRYATELLSGGAAG